MNEFIKMDVFFLVATFSVAVLATLIAVILFYVIRILRNVDHVSSRVAEESDNLKADIATLRANIREQGLKVKHIADFFGTIHKRSTRHKKKSAHEEDSHNNN